MWLFVYINRTLFASKVIHGGDCNLKVPFNAVYYLNLVFVFFVWSKRSCWRSNTIFILLNFQQITPDELPTDVKSLFDWWSWKHRKGCYSSYDQEEHGSSKLASTFFGVWFFDLRVYDCFLNQNSRWFPYISRLPQLAEMHSAVRFWKSWNFCCGQYMILKTMVSFFSLDLLGWKWVQHDSL